MKKIILIIAVLMSVSISHAEILICKTALAEITMHLTGDTSIIERSGHVDGTASIVSEMIFYTKEPRVMDKIFLARTKPSKKREPMTNLKTYLSVTIDNNIFELSFDTLSFEDKAQTELPGVMSHDFVNLGNKASRAMGCNRSL